MNEFTSINVSYIKPSRTVETILLESKNEKRILYVYNYEGVHFRVFNFIKDIVSFFDNEFNTEIEFESDEELDNYLAYINLKDIPLASSIIN